MSKYRVWQCRIYVDAEQYDQTPDGFDLPPRRAAVETVEKHIPVVACFSGWGAEPQQDEVDVIEKDEDRTDA